MADHKDKIYGPSTNYAPSPRPVYIGVLFDAVVKTSRDQRMSKPKKKQNKSVCGNAFVGKIIPKSIFLGDCLRQCQMKMQSNAERSIVFSYFISHKSNNTT